MVTQSATSLLRHRVILTLIIAFASLFFVPSNEKMFFSGDDDDYFAVASSIAFGEFPSFSNEYHAGEKMPFASVGAGVMASPFVMIFSMLDRHNNLSIVNKRTLSNRDGSASSYGFYIATQFYLIIATIFLYNLLCLWVDSRSAFYTTVLTLLAGGGIFIYAFNRPIMSHVYELFSLTTVLLLLSKGYLGKPGRILWMALGLATSFVFLTRYNNAPIVVGVFLVLLHWTYTKKISITDVALVMIFSALPVLIFRILPVISNGFSVEDSSYLNAGERLLFLHDIEFYYSRLIEILSGTDMGITYTAPAIILSFIGYAFYVRKMPAWYSTMATLLVFNLFMSMQWCSAGSYYGYRHFIFTATPLLAVFLALLIQPAIKSIGNLSASLLLILFSWTSICSALVFGVYQLGYSLNLGTTSCGFPAYQNFDYQITLIKLLSNDPFKPFFIAWERSFGGILGMSDLVDRSKLLMLYVFPFIMTGIIFIYGIISQNSHTYKKYEN
jgi:hypothetical protein